MDFNKLLFRASANGEIMTPGSGEITQIQLGKIKELESKPKLTPLQEEELQRLIEKRDNPTLSLTCIKRLIVMEAQERGREEEIKSKYMTKGTIAEQDAITLYSLIRKKMFRKNEVHLTNKYVQGTLDVADGVGDEIVNIQDSEEIIDIKCSWSYITFKYVKFKETNSDYDWQGNTYMALVPKAKRFRLAYCLVNSPAEVIFAEKRKLKFSLIDSEDFAIDVDMNPAYIEGCQQIERNHIFDLAMFRYHYPNFEFHTDLETWIYDIPKEQRVHEIVIERDNEKIAKLYNKITRCREWMALNL